MTAGEIGRSLNRLEISQREQTETLGEIKDQTIKTNGRVTALERDVRDLKRHRHTATREGDRSDVMTFTIPVGAISTKTVALVITALVSGLIAAWKAGLF